MVKSFKEPSSNTISRDKKDKLLQLMDKSKISLLRASQLLDIPYNSAKQILFIYSTPRKLASLTPTSARSSVNSPEEKPSESKYSEKEKESKHRKKHGSDEKMRSSRKEHKHPKTHLFC